MGYSAARQQDLTRTNWSDAFAARHVTRPRYWFAALDCGQYFTGGIGLQDVVDAPHAALG